VKGDGIMDKKGFGMKTSSENNYYKLLSGAKPNIQDLKVTAPKSVSGKRSPKKTKG